MPLLRTPSSQLVRDFLATQARFDFTYDAVGATSGRPPGSYAVDHARVQLGVGWDVFIAAKLALERWQQFPPAWLDVYPGNMSIEPGNTVAITARSLGLWWLNACRIVYVIDDLYEACRYGFAHGTLPSHMGKGEERFLVEMDADERVWYDILAFSRPNGVLATIGYPHMRRVQRLFRRQSAAQMQAIAETPADIKCFACPS